MFDDIRNWEIEAGEDFCDYFESNINEVNFIFWCLGKGYLTEEQVNIWNRRKLSTSFTEILCSEEEFSVIQEDGDEEYDKAYRILAEFLSSTDEYQKRVDEFLSGVEQIKMDKALASILRGNEKIILKADGREFKIQKDTVIDIPIVRIISGKWYRDNNEDGE
jgi:hypothetical protein